MSVSPLRAQELDGLSVDELPTDWDVPFVEVWRRIDSTSDRAMELARSGAPPWTVVLADEQVRGRGRHGGRWLSGPGAGLWMSIVLDGADAGPEVTLVVGVAIAEAIEAVVPGVEVSIRWPNDLMIEGGKVGGILAERGSGRLVVGIGVNLTIPDDGFPPLRTPPAALNRFTPTPVSRRVLAGRAIRDLRSWLAKEHPVSEAIRVLSRRDALLGRWVSTEQYGEGIARGIDLDGLLVLERADGTRVRTAAGRVTLLAGPGVGGATQGDSSTSSLGR